jgi:hypothetical protein
MGKGNMTMTKAEAWVMIPLLNRDKTEFDLNLYPLVMCKNCKHGEQCNEGDIYCNKDIGTFESPVHKPEWFCADGERKQKNG